MLIIIYWLHKYNLLRRYSVLHDISRQLAVEMIEMLESFKIIFLIILKYQFYKSSLLKIKIYKDMY